VGHAGKAADAATLRIVSFNIEFGVHVDSAIGLLTSDPALRAADVILLQEMDGEGTERVADALGFWYVYFPAIYHLRTHREFGNAVLSRWPIVEDRKILLPHTACAAAGTVLDVRRTSDHRPVWVAAMLR
jgi:endonuclease/exonuclease/phosphatase family metal-dependent hydrolase